MSVHKTTNGRWEVRYRDDSGRNRSKTFDRKLGRGGADEFDGKMKKHRRDGDRVDPDREGMLLRDFFHDVFLETRYASEATRVQWNVRWAPQRDALRNVWHIEEKWGGWKLKDINRREPIMRWHTEMRRAGGSDARLWRAHDLLVTLISHAVDMDYLPRIKILDLYPDYTPARSKVGPWLPDTIEAIRNDLLHRAQFPPKPSKRGGGVNGARRQDYAFRRRRDAEVVSFMGYHAARIGEAFALEWPQLLNGAGTGIGAAVHVLNTVSVDERERTKTRNDRSVPLNSFSRGDLREWWLYCGRPTEGLVFPRDPQGSAWSTGDVSNWRRSTWLKVLKRLELPAVPPKFLRHSCVSMWIRERMDVGTVADQAGHSIEVCLDTYRHAFRNLEPGEMFSMVDAIAEARNGHRDRAAM